ncbi:MAG: AraC family transcriptional regulator [Clostridiales bacterium]|nr:AraC family transcriptional regulator [Clostridiales bacterium]
MDHYFHENLKEAGENGFKIDFLEGTPFYYPAHWHYALELLFCTKGFIFVKVGDGESMTAHTQQTFLLNTMTIHESWSHEAYEGFCVHLFPDDMKRYVSTFDKLRFSLSFSSNDLERAKAMSRINANMMQIALLHKEQPEGYLLECAALVYSTTQVLVQHFSHPLVEEEVKTAQTGIARLKPLLDYIDLHHAEELTLDGAADYMGVTKEYFCRLFKKNMGVSLTRYVNSVRIAHICEEMKYSDLNISELAEKHGFANIKLMNQMFRELYGCTPSQKRKELTSSK